MLGGVPVVERGEVVSLAPDGSVSFSAGPTCKADAVIWCTGYHYEFPFFASSNIVDTSNYKKTTPLYLHLLHVKYPSLAVFGVPWKVAPFPQDDLQARLVAALWSGSVAVVPRTEREEWCRRECQRRERDLRQPPRYAHMLGPEQWAYNDELARMSGTEPLPAYVAEMYRDTASWKAKAPACYRDLEYSVTDPSTGTWKVAMSPQHKCCDAANSCAALPRE
eukprot:m.224807 g.224807  ORF g.224807 m.224807 type:complete len:221 (-) comp18777_c0_seq5:34-696(-)